MSSRSAPFYGASLLALSALHPQPAFADDASFPRVEGEVSVEIQNDYTYDSDDPDAELNDTYTTTEPGVSVRLTPELSIEGAFVFEPVQDPGPGDDRFFDDHGLYAENLYLQYATDRFSLFAGKINPTFGVAWDLAPGIYGTEFAEDGYELAERIGAGGSVTFGNETAGAHTLTAAPIMAATAATFFADTTFLSESTITDRGRLRESDGGVSNTEDFSSFSVTLDGDASVLVDGLSYHVGVESQEGGVGDPEDELGFAAALYGEFPIAPEFAIAPIVEYVRLNDAGGANADQDLVTAGAALLHGPWNLSTSYTYRSTDTVGGSEDDDLFQLSAGYEFENGITADVGYRYTEEAGIETNTLGFLIAYGFEFSAP